VRRPAVLVSVLTVGLVALPLLPAAAQEASPAAPPAPTPAAEESVVSVLLDAGDPLPEPFELQV
jgi:hypothetical protein